MKAEIIAVGTELLLGQINNTNARYLSEKLAQLGIDVYWHVAVGDNEGRLREAIKTALGRSDLIIFCGGLGPTKDDLTKETVADILELPLVRSMEWEKRLQETFARLGRTMTPNNLKQALLPEGARLLDNRHGTAPGIYIKWRDKILVLLPGPPRELEPMFETEVMPLLRDKEGGVLILSRVLKVTGVGESALEEVLADLFERQSNPTIAPLAKVTEVHLRLTAKAGSSAEANAMLDRLEEQVRGRLGQAVYGTGEETLADAVAKLLLQAGKTLAVAESCTGGLLSHLLTSVPGSSAYFLQGLITYSNQAKTDLLGIKPSLLREYGAVSEETARAMAEHVRHRAQSDYSLAVTGIAGPGGGSEEKPVGLVYIALGTGDGTHCKRFNLWGDRQTIKERAAAAALNMLRLHLLKSNG